MELGGGCLRASEVKREGGKRLRYISIIMVQ